MKIPGSGLRLDEPCWPLLQAQISYWGITTAAGNVLGTTLIDALCSTIGQQPSYAGLSVKMLDGPAAGQVRQINVHALATGTMVVPAPWTNPAGAVQQIAAGTRFVILSFSGGGGVPPAPPPPGIGLWMFGVCDPGMVASLNTLVLTNLAGFNDDIFNNEFWIQVIHNASAPGAAPEREIRRITDYVGATGTFTTDAFSVNVEANDLVCVFHESIMGIEIMGYGTLTTSDATVPADANRAAAYPWENNNYFAGCLLVPTEGNCRLQYRRILNYTAVGGVFTLDPNNPFSQAPGQVDYVIVGDQTEFVPAANGGNNRIPSDVVGNKASTAIFAPDNVSDIIRYLKGILGSLNAGLEPSRSLLETWQDVLGINPNIWTTVNPATGAAWVAPTEVGAFLYATATPNANETARLRSVQQWVVFPNTPNLNLIVKKTILEWEMVVGVVANLDNTLTFWGFTNGPNDDRSSNDLIGFGLIGDALQTITDVGGAPTVNTGFGENLALHNKLRIEIYEGTVDFYLNEVLIATHVTNLPANPMYIQRFLDTEATGACAYAEGIVKCWYEMVERY